VLYHKLYQLPSDALHKTGRSLALGSQGMSMDALVLMALASPLSKGHTKSHHRFLRNGIFYISSIIILS